MIEIIPAIDLIDGKCVRLAQGDFSRKKIYGENPLEAALKFEDAGLKRLHVVDLDGARRGRISALKILEEICAKTSLTVDFGGGIKTDENIRAVFDAGARMASVGSTAVARPERFFGWLGRFGGERILLGADARGEKLAVDGWQTETEIEVVPFLQNCYAKGVSQAFVTDISKDGLLQGSAVALYRRILARVPGLKLIASGGVSRIEDIQELEKVGCAGVIIGKAFYEGRISLKDLAALSGGNKAAEFAAEGR